VSAIFDHLTAILVGAVLVGALLFVEMRQQESAVEATVRNRVEHHAAEFLAAVQRDAENIRTRAQAQHAFGGAYRFTLRQARGADGELYTKQFSFPTLLDPSRGGRSPVALVTYEMTPTGQTVRVGTSQRPTYRVVRHEYTRAGGSRETGGAASVLGFNVILVGADGSDQAVAETVNETPAQVRVSVMMAAPVGPQRTGDQATTTMQNAARRTATIRVVGATASEGFPPVEPGTAGLPPLPGDPPPPPPPPPSPGGGGGSPGGGSPGGPRGGSSSGGGSGGGSSPAPPPPPSLPGRDI
jgi:hypothetical protein